MQPFVALGASLAGGGLDVTVATHEPFREFVTRRGLAFEALPGDPRELLATDEAQELLRSGVGLVRFARRFVSLLEPWFWELVAAVTPIHAKSDASLYSALAFPTWHLAQIDRTPTIQLSLQPLLPTSMFPAITTAVPGLGPLGNRITHTVNQQLFWQPLRQAVDRWRTQDLGLPPQGIKGPYRELERKGEPVLHGFSPHLVPPPPDWPERAMVTGHWPLSTDDALDEQTVAFLEAGPPPVYIGFGSIRDAEAERLSDIAITAARKSGSRLVLGSGWAELRSAASDDVHVVGETDHTRLFPRMRAVVHHGGAGTTHTAAAAGVPSMAVPYFADQPFWGRRLHELGVGAPPLSRRKLDAELLSERIALLDRDDVRVRASNLGDVMRTERGLGRAVDFILGHLDRG